MTTLGLDIGGANIKAATAHGVAESTPFPLWKTPEQLSAALRSLITHSGDIDRLAVTMTGELADCFATKAEGVERILAAVQAAAEGRCVKVWSTAGRFITPDEAVADPFAVAAANWHALATWAGQHYPCRAGLLIDIGSTTTDIIPLRDGVPCSVGQTDLTRLQSSELVYTGVRRTPLAAVANTVPFRGQAVVISSELFATTLDVHLLRGDIAEDATDTDTANGRPATRTHAVDRIARMLCADRTEITDDEFIELTRSWADHQCGQIAAAVECVLRRQRTTCESVVISGSGTFLARRVTERVKAFNTAEIIALSDVLSPGIAETACAFAVACLAETRSL